MHSGGVLTSGTDVLACQFTADELRLVVEEAHAAVAARRVDVCPTLGRPPGSRPRRGYAPSSTGWAWTRRARCGTPASCTGRGSDWSAGPTRGSARRSPTAFMPECGVELVRAGLVPAEALSASTSEAARACGLGDRTGRLAPGLDADLPAVEGDPLADPAALRTVRLVVARGRPVG